MSPATATATKDRLLSAAFEEFSKRGFAGARVDEIASKAGANKALIYQYYGDKEALFKQVLECKMRELARIATDDPTRLHEAVGEFFDFHAANPDLSRLMLWEALEFGPDAVPNESERKKHLLDHVAEIEEFQSRGMVDPELDARMTLVTLIGMVHVWFSLPQVARMVAGMDPYSPEALRKRRTHVVHVARKILEVR
jgi:AcrR family transcriptional regulator